MKTLYLFATSLRADPYVNAIVHSVHNLDVTAVTVVTITESGSTRSEAAATSVLSSITRLLHELCEEATEDAPHLYTEALKSVVDFRALTVPLNDLDLRIAELTKKGNAIFDVTALRKDLLVDIVALCTSRSFTRIYTFELRREPHYDQRDLIHNLRLGADYIYRNLTASTAVQLAVSRIQSRTISTKTLLAATGLLVVALILTQIFWPRGWVMTLFALASVACGIVQTLALFLRDQRPRR